MAQLKKIEKKEQIKSSPDKFYNFYRNNMSDLVNIFPDKIPNALPVTGKGNGVGSVTHWTYVVEDGTKVNANIKIDSFDDVNRTMNIEFIEGDVNKLYKSFRPTMKVKKGYAEWSFEVEKAYEDAPDPDMHVNFAIQVLTKALDDYLLKN